MSLLLIFHFILFSLIHLVLLLLASLLLLIFLYMFFLFCFIYVYFILFLCIRYGIIMFRTNIYRIYLCYIIIQIYCFFIIISYILFKILFPSFPFTIYCVFLLISFLVTFFHKLIIYQFSIKSPLKHQPIIIVLIIINYCLNRLLVMEVRWLFFLFFSVKNNFNYLNNSFTLLSWL